MTENIKRQLDFIKSRKHRELRRDLSKDEKLDIERKIYDKKLSEMKRVTLALKLFLEYEKNIILPDTKIQGIRTIKEFPEISYDDEFKKTHYVHEKGKVTNVVWSIESVLKEGLEGRRNRLLKGAKRDAEFVDCVLEMIDFIETFCDGYNNENISKIIRYGANSLQEAFQLFRLLHFVLWGTSCYHNTVGRFDIWAYPYYLSDKAKGMTDEEVLEIIEDFFLSFNRDSDLYYSLAWGDNGQSLVLGGVDKNGNCVVNELTYLALKASKELRQIDPKINLRVDKNTPIELYEAGTELTKTGLGFPQYSNDDVVIPCLEHWGYSKEDARNYAIAACWEFIIPEKSLDIPNIAGICIAEATDKAIKENLENCKDTNMLFEYVEKELVNKCKAMAESLENLYMEPCPYMSLLTDDCLDRGFDISKGMTYNNYGFHGTGFSCGADQISAIDSLMFKQKLFTPKRLINAIETNFEQDMDLKHLLRNNADKMGRDKNADEIGNRLLGIFADSVSGLKNERGGIFRAGTGSAMYYVWHSENLGATADGRLKGEYFPANFSPSLFLTNSGPVSVLLGFTCENLKRTSNGGPVTFELHDKVFENEENVKKVAGLVRTYILKGGHQLQLNAVDKEKLIKAQKEPERYRDLIVRVWGWSGHFTELSKTYQDQIIKRCEYEV